MIHHIVDDEILLCQQGRYVLCSCSHVQGSIPNGAFNAILQHGFALMLRLTTGSIMMLLSASSMPHDSSWAGNERGPIEPHDKLLGAGRLGARYLIGSLEHSSVRSSRAPPGAPVGVASQS